MKLALDIGNSTVKGTLLDDNNVVVVNLQYPSAVTTVSDRKYLNYTSSDDVYIQVIESELEHFPVITATGQRAIEMPDYQEFDVTSSGYKANNMITTALLFGGIAPYLEDHTELKVALSVPIVEAKTIVLMDSYKKTLEGKHRILVFRDNEVSQVTITITLAVVINEGQAGFFGMFDTIDDDFRGSLDLLYHHLGEDSDPISEFEDFLIVDIGEGTTDLAVFRNKKFNPDFSYSVTKGYGNLLEDAIALAARENLTIESRKDLQKLLTTTNKRRQERKLKWEGYVRPTKAEFIEKVVNTILKTYGTRDYFDAIIFVGGGFAALTGYRVDGQGIHMDDDTLFIELNKELTKLNKSVGLLFGIPEEYSQGINERGLTQVITNV